MPKETEQQTLNITVQRARVANELEPTILKERRDKDAHAFEFKRQGA